MVEYIGYRLTRLKGAIKFIKDVLVQTYKDECGLPRTNYDGQLNFAIF